MTFQTNHEKHFLHYCIWRNFFHFLQQIFNCESFVVEPIPLCSVGFKQISWNKIFILNLIFLNQALTQNFTPTFSLEILSFFEFFFGIFLVGCDIPPNKNLCLDRVTFELKLLAKG